MMMNGIPKQLIEVVKRLEAVGFTAYLAGGCVRDMLLGTVPNDYDVATSATPEQVCHIFSDCKVIPTGIKHGTVTVHYGGFAIEITTFRSDGVYTDHRHPLSVSFSASAAEDSERRDFTVNAMYCTAEGEVLDYHGGKADLENGVIRCVGDAEKRFNEDALRILRALRFSARLGFEIEESTLAAMQGCAGLLRHIAAERVLAELKGFFKHCGSAALCADNTDVFSALFGAPRCEATKLRALAGVNEEFRLAAFFAMYGGKDLAQELIKGLKPDNNTEFLVCAAVDALYGNALSSPEDIAAAVSKYGARTYGYMLDAAQLLGNAPCAQARSIQDRLISGQLPETVQGLKLSGTDLMQVYSISGPRLGAVLKALFTDIYSGMRNEKEVLLKAAKKHIEREHL